MFLLPILERAHVVRPGDSVQPWSLIDDTVARCEGHPSFIEPAFVKVSQALVQGLREHRLVISDETCFLCTSKNLAKPLGKILLGSEVPCQVASAAVDLGVDTTQGKSRRMGKSKDRLKKAARRFGRIRRLRRSAKHSRISKGLWTTGAIP